ncbi:MAG: PVC-type heme-binding CxxCH protein, partial [Planctomycetaceae bacterium]
NDDFRKVVLNAIVWTAGGDVPEAGVPSATPTVEEIEANQDYPKPEKQSSIRPKRPRVATRGLELVAVERTPEESRELNDAISQLDVHDQLQVSLFAGEPLLHNPANIDIDHLGRVWVCEAVNYRAFRNADIIGERAKDGDRILIVEDADGDGRADRTTVFYQGQDVDSAHGICVLPAPDGRGTRAIISALDQVFFLVDDDGDLKADRKEVLFTGISGSQHDHGIHAVVFGPDGKLYFNFGNAGKQICDKNGQPLTDKAGNVVNDTRHPYQEGMVFRCNLDGGEFETLAWNFRNNWEVCVDSFGRLWQSDNDDDGNQGVRINYVMEYGNYGYKDELTGAGWREPRTGWEETIPERHWRLNDSGVVPNLLQTGGGSPTGICIYEGDLLPEGFRNQIIHCDAGPNVVRCYPVQPDGAGFKAEIVNILEGTRDKWFRPSDVCVAPDGSLIVADWYDPGVGGHRMQDIDRGRLFRVTPKGNAAKSYTSPKVDVSSVEGAIAALRSPNLATRALGWTALQGMGDASVPALDAMFRTDPNERMRARAQWVLCKMQNQAGMLVMLNPLKPGDEFTDELRAVALRAIRQTDFTGTMHPQGIEESSVLRRELAIMLRGRDSKTADALWTQIAQHHDPADRWELEALGIGADGHWNSRLAAWLERVGDDWKSTVGRNIIWRSRADRTPVLLAEIVQSPETPSADLPRMMRAFDFQSSPDMQDVLRRLAVAELADTERTGFINAEAFDRLNDGGVADGGKLNAALNRVLDAERGTSRFVRLIQKFSVPGRDDELLAMAQREPQSQRAADAVNVLLTRAQQQPLRGVVFGDDLPAAESVLEALATAASGRSGPLLTELLNDEDRPIAVRRAAARALGRNKNGAQQLRGLAEQGGYDERLGPAIAGALHAADDPNIREAAAKLFPLPAAKDSEPLPPLSELLGQKGNIEKGRIIFHSTGTCTKCHIVNGLGREVGPNLSEIGKKLSKPAMFESILYPSAGLSHNYESWTLVTADGEIVTGLLVSETDDEVQIKDVNALVRTVKTGDIELKKKQDVSLMPADLQKVMSAEELVDVVEYMTTLTVRTQ